MKTCTEKKRGRKCSVCATLFFPSLPMQKVCGLECAKSLAMALGEKREKRNAAAARKAAAKERAATREALQKFKPLGKYRKEAQAAFNAYIRARDYGKPCICCGLFSAGPGLGGDWDAGHYRSRGSAHHLAFDERNVHRQLKYCNQYLAGNVVGYRKGLIERIGLEALEALESDNTERRYRKEDYEAMKKHYREKEKAEVKKHIAQEKKQ